jgi:histidyl-tRNA synthetase
VEETARRVSRLYGYRELRTPMIEDAGLFLRSVGETSDIVQKEMFRVTPMKSGGDQELVLRPEGTASIVRAYLEHNLHKTEGFLKLFYLGPMFRAERPQAGRLRQFHQFGVEAIGSESSWVDVETIVLCVQILRECGVTQWSLWLTSMGCREDQGRGIERLRNRLEGHRHTLCTDCQSRFDRNVFRVLDCKNPTCQQVVEGLSLEPTIHRAGFPPMLYALCDACGKHFDTVRDGLRQAQVPFDDTTVFARGLDYYTRTVFEVRAKGLGAQDAVAAGGRYDHLVEEFGGPRLGAFGFAAGMERVLMAGAAEGASGGLLEGAERSGLYLAVVAPELVGEAFRLIQHARGQGIPAVMDGEGKSLKAQLREADKARCRFVAILGEAELKARTLTLKDLGQGTQETVPMEALCDTIQGRP